MNNASTVRGSRMRSAQWIPSPFRITYNYNNISHFEWANRPNFQTWYPLQFLTCLKDLNNQNLPVHWLTWTFNLITLRPRLHAYVDKKSTILEPQPVTKYQHHSPISTPHLPRRQNPTRDGPTSNLKWTVKIRTVIWKPDCYGNSRLFESWMETKFPTS